MEDFYKDSPKRQRADFYQFKAGKTFFSDQGQERCDVTEPQTTVSGWDINADGTILLAFKMHGRTSAELYEIKELTQNKLRISQTLTKNRESLTAEIAFTGF